MSNEDFNIYLADELMRVYEKMLDMYQGDDYAYVSVKLCGMKRKCIVKPDDPDHGIRVKITRYGQGRPLSLVKSSEKTEVTERHIKNCV